MPAARWISLFLTVFAVGCATSQSRSNGLKIEEIATANVPGYYQLTIKGENLDAVDSAYIVHGLQNIKTEVVKRTSSELSVKIVRSHLKPKPAMGRDAVELILKRGEEAIASKEISDIYPNNLDLPM